jgi:pimeloyl-ACP methyl ester carboxylesterase
MPKSAIVSRIAHDACLELPTHRPGGRWWEELPTDFAAETEGFQLALRDALSVRAGATMDLVLRTVASTAVTGLAYPLGFRPEQVKRSFEDRELYIEAAESGEPTRFFRMPPKRVDATVKDARFPLFRPRDGSCLDIRFESPYVPASPTERLEYLKHRKNRFAHARWWRHHRGPRPTIVAIHGFSADFYHLNEYFFALPWLYELGFDVVLHTLPFHGKRQTSFSPFSGFGFFSGGLSRINEAFGQAVYDFRILYDHLTEVHLVPKIGVTGVSLGGYSAALLAAVEPRLAFSVPIVPVVSLADLALEWQPMGTLMRAGMHLLKKEIVDARHFLAVTSPLTYRPALPRERLMVVGGVADRLAPPKHARLLWEHWDRCRLHWFAGNHLVHFDRGAYLREIARFLRDVGFFEGLPRRKPKRGLLRFLRR